MRHYDERSVSIPNYDGEGTRLESLDGLTHEGFWDYCNGVKPELVSSLGRTAKSTLAESELFHIKHDLQALIDSNLKVTRNWLIATCILSVIISAIVFFAASFVVFAIVFSVLFCIVLAFVFEFKRGKVSENKLEAIENGRFAAYRFDIKEKMWRPYRSSKERLKFFIDCHSHCFEVERFVYEMLSDKVIVVLYYLEKKTVLDFVVPDDASNAA